MFIFIFILYIYIYIFILYITVYIYIVVYTIFFKYIYIYIWIPFEYNMNTIWIQYMIFDVHTGAHKTKRCGKANAINIPWLGAVYNGHEDCDFGEIYGIGFTTLLNQGSQNTQKNAASPIKLTLHDYGIVFCTTKLTLHDYGLLCFFPQEIPEIPHDPLLRGLGLQWWDWGAGPSLHGALAMWPTLVNMFTHLCWEWTRVNMASQLGYNTTQTPEVFMRRWSVGSPVGARFCSIIVAYCGYGSIRINMSSSGRYTSIYHHLPPILMFARGRRFWLISLSHLLLLSHMDVLQPKPHDLWKWAKFIIPSKSQTHWHTV